MNRFGFLFVMLYVFDKHNDDVVNSNNFNYCYLLIYLTIELQSNQYEGVLYKKLSNYCIILALPTLSFGSLNWLFPKARFRRRSTHVPNLIEFDFGATLGKITVLKSLIASQLVYILSPLPTEHYILNEMNKVFFNFLWNGKGDKIKRNIMIGDYSQGGLRMIDIQSFNKALKTMWVIKYLDESNLGKWKLFFDNELINYGGTAVFKGNLKKEDLPKIKGLSDICIK